MKYTLKKLKNSALEVHLTFDKEDEAGYTKKALEELKKEVSIKGFRKGSVPDEKVKQHVGEAGVKQRMIEVALQKGMYEVLQKENLRFLGHPKIDLKGIDPLKLVVVIDIMPELKAIALKKFKVKKKEVSVSQKDIDEALENIRNHNVSWNVVERKAKEWDRVEIDFEGSIDGKAFPGGTAKHHPLVLGENTFIPGFEKQLEGIKAGDETEVKITFPKDYFHKEFQGKEAIFKVKAYTVSEKVLPELTDEFVNTMTKGQFKTLDDFKKEIEQVILQEKKQVEIRRIENEILEQLVKHNDIDLPTSIIHDESKYILENLKKDLESRHMSLEQYMQMRNLTEEKLMEDIKKEAEKRVAIRLNLRAIAKEHGITVSQGEIDDFMKGQESPKGMSEEDIKGYVEHEISLKKAYQKIYDESVK